jgi:DNA-binding Xre family transcriptional regulator
MITIKPLLKQFKQSDLTQVTFARLVGVNEGRFSRIMNGYTLPNMRELNDICEALQCGASDVIEWEVDEIE